MRSYALLIEDERYTVPTLVIVTTGGDERAREIALQHLIESPHHLAVELRADEELVFKFNRSEGCAGSGENSSTI